MCRSESVTAFFKTAAVASASIPSSIVLPLDLLIFAPSVPKRLAAEDSKASGARKTGRSGSTRP